MNAVRCTCPAQARAIVDELEAKVAADGDDRLSTGLFDDRNPGVPGSSEPPD